MKDNKKVMGQNSELQNNNNKNYKPEVKKKMFALECVYVKSFTTCLLA